MNGGPHARGQRAKDARAIGTGNALLGEEPHVSTTTTMTTAPASGAKTTAPTTAISATGSAETQAIVAQAIGKVASIATLPEITAQIIKTVEDPRSSAAQLHKIIAHDPAMVTRILKVVNSSFYGLPGQIGSIERAIVLLGLNAVKNIAVAASLGQLFRGVTICEGFSAKDLWTHCVGVAVTARHLAREMKAPIADEAFLAGMIHDIGILVELQVWPDKLRIACDKSKASGGDFCAAEREVMGVDHQQLGAGIAEQWKFPRSCQLVAGFHHQPAMLSDINRLMVTLVFVADTLCCGAKWGFNLTALNQKVYDGALADVKLDASLVEKTQANLPAILESSKGMF
jgi:putative nucleotidyltransferase with HDIG domain